MSMKETSDLQDIIEWDIPNWSLALDFWRKETSLDLSCVEALEIGSRNGGLSLWVAQQGGRVLCTDLEGPTKQARETHNRHGVAHLIQYESLNALDIPYKERFDLVLFKSVLGGIGRGDHPEKQVKAIQEMYQSLRRGGELFIAENLTASAVHRFLRKRFVTWGAQWRYVSIMEMLDFLTEFSEIRYQAVGFMGAFGRNPSLITILGSMDRLIFNRLTPKPWRYIFIGIARK
jgi:SAM-dependent methyltransferase